MFCIKSWRSYSHSVHSIPQQHESDILIIVFGSIRVSPLRNWNGLVLWAYFAWSGGTSLNHSRSMLPCSLTSRLRKSCTNFSVSLLIWMVFYSREHIDSWELCFIKILVIPWYALQACCSSPVLWWCWQYR